MSTEEQDVEQRQGETERQEATATEADQPVSEEEADQQQQQREETKEEQQDEEEEKVEDAPESVEKESKQEQEEDLDAPATEANENEEGKEKRTEQEQPQQQEEESPKQEVQEQEAEGRQKKPDEEEEDATQAAPKEEEEQEKEEEEEEKEVEGNEESAAEEDETNKANEEDQQQQQQQQQEATQSDEEKKEKAEQEDPTWRKTKCKHCGVVIEGTHADRYRHRVSECEATAAAAASNSDEQKSKENRQPICCIYCGHVFKRRKPGESDEAEEDTHDPAECLRKNMPSIHKKRLLRESGNNAVAATTAGAVLPLATYDAKMHKILERALKRPGDPGNPLLSNPPPPSASNTANPTSAGAAADRLLRETGDPRDMRWTRCRFCNKRLVRHVAPQHEANACIVASALGKVERLEELVAAAAADEQEQDADAVAAVLRKAPKVYGQLPPAMILEEEARRILAQLNVVAPVIQSLFVETSTTNDPKDNPVGVAIMHPTLKNVKPRLPEIRSAVEQWKDAAFLSNAPIKSNNNASGTATPASTSPQRASTASVTSATTKTNNSRHKAVILHAVEAVDRSYNLRNVLYPPRLHHKSVKGSATATSHASQLAKTNTSNHIAERNVQTRRRKEKQQQEQDDDGDGDATTAFSDETLALARAVCYGTLSLDEAVKRSIGGGDGDQ